MGEDQVFGVAFPVERWAKLIERKLEQGYDLIIENRNAMLFMRGRGYEPCPYRIAQMLIGAGVIEPAGSHVRGLRYQLVPGTSVAAFLKRDPDDEDVEDTAAAETDVEGDVDDEAGDETSDAEDRDDELVTM